MLYIMRHGKTEWNALHKIQGRTDIPLNEEGRLMAEKAIIKDERLMEMSFGDYEGIENSFAIPDCPINILFQKPGEYHESIGGAETWEELFARTGAFLKEVIEPQLQEGKDILIVGHGAMNASIICQVKGMPIEEFWSAGLEQCKILEV